MSDGEPGYVYLLVNYSMPGLVKVGRSTRRPGQRVSELSSVTGVPTPFELVFDVYVSDCQAVEREIHDRLAQAGLRVSDDREFFDAPIREVVRLMRELEEEYPAFPGDEARAEAGRMFTDIEVATPEEADAVMRELERRQALDPTRGTTEILLEIRDEIRQDRSAFYREAAANRNAEKSTPATEEDILAVVEELEQEETRIDIDQDVLEDRDELFAQAARLIVVNDAGSTSLLQRRLRIGYGRAARIIDQLHHAGIVGPSRGSRPRDVLVDREERKQILHADRETRVSGSDPWWKFW